MMSRKYCAIATVFLEMCRYPAAVNLRFGIVGAAQYGMIFGRN